MHDLEEEEGKIKYCSKQRVHPVHTTRACVILHRQTDRQLSLFLLTDSWSRCCSLLNSCDESFVMLRFRNCGLNGRDRSHECYRVALNRHPLQTRAQCSSTLLIRCLGCFPSAIGPQYHSPLDNNAPRRAPGPVPRKTWNCTCP